MNLAQKRAMYYRCIYTYKIRRRKLKIKYGIKGQNSDYKNISNEYIVQSALYTNKMRVWAQNIKRIDALTDKMDKLVRDIKQFTGKGILNQVGQKVDKDTKVAKAIYYKFGIEVLSIAPKTLRLYIGVTNNRQPSVYRSNITNSLTGKEIYSRFKEYKGFKI